MTKPTRREIWLVELGTLDLIEIIYFLQLQKRLIDAQRRAQCDQLFEHMNSKCTGLIKRERLETALKQYKEGSVIDQIEQSQYALGIPVLSKLFVTSHCRKL